MTAPHRVRDHHKPTSKDQLVKERFLVWLAGLDAATELGPFVARWLFAGFEHVLDRSESWDEFSTRKPKGPMAGTYWVQVLTGDDAVDEQLLAAFEEDFLEEGTDYAVLVSAKEFSEATAAHYERDSRVLLFGPEYFLRKFAGLLYHPDSWDLMLARAVREMAHPEKLHILAEPQPVGGQPQPRSGGQSMGNRDRGPGRGPQQQPQPSGQPPQQRRRFPPKKNQPRQNTPN